MIILDTPFWVAVLGAIGAAVVGCIGGVLGAIPGILQILGTLPVGLLGCLVCGLSCTLPSGGLSLFTGCGSGGIWDAIVACLESIGTAILAFLNTIGLTEVGKLIPCILEKILELVGIEGLSGTAALGGLALGGPFGCALGCTIVVVILLILGIILCCLGSICIAVLLVMAIVCPIIVGIIGIVLGMLCTLPCPCIGIPPIIIGLVMVGVCGCIPLGCIILLITGGIPAIGPIIGTIVTACMGIPGVGTVLTTCVSICMSIPGVGGILSACAGVPVIGPILAAAGLSGGWETYEDPQGRFSIEYPADWTCWAGVTGFDVSIASGDGAVGCSVGVVSEALGRDTTVSEGEVTTRVVDVAGENYAVFLVLFAPENDFDSANKTYFEPMIESVRVG